MKMMKRHDDERGMALYAVAVLLVVLAAISTSIFTGAIASKQELDGVQASIRRYYLAEAGMTHAILDLNLGGTGALGTPGAPVPFGDGGYWVTAGAQMDGTITITAYGIAGGGIRGLRAAVQDVSKGMFHNAVYAGNKGGSPGNAIELGGLGAYADYIDGDVYSASGIQVTGDAAVTGTVRAGGAIDGIVGTTGVHLPLWDASDLRNASSHDVNVAADFQANESYAANSSLGGSAWQVPESLPSHIFRKNPSDRATECSCTGKDDYFLEDPYAAVQVGTRTVTTVEPTVTYVTQQVKVLDCRHQCDADDSPCTESHCYHVHDPDSCYKLVDQQVPVYTYPDNYIPEDGDDVNSQGITLAETGGNGVVYYIDGNLWIHNRHCYGFAISSSGGGVQVTFVVKGNVYFADDLRYDQMNKDGVAFVALKDDAVADSGNIYFGDPVYGTVIGMDAFLYAENTFHDWNLDTTNSEEVNLHGIMAAGDRVEIHRDAQGQRTRLMVDFDSRVKDQTLWLPGLPTMPGPTGKVPPARYKIQAMTEVSR